MLTTALAGVGVAIAIPLVIKALIDGPITNGEIDPVLPLGLLVLALGVLEAFLTWWRRWVQSNAVLSVETAMRRDLYARLQELPMSFHSRWQSGQLLSRATTDLVGDPAVLRLRHAVPAHQHPPGHRHDRACCCTCTGRSAWSSPRTAAPIVWLSMRFEKRYVVVSRRVQDEQGDLATPAEEGAVGIRVIKSFGRSRARLASSTKRPPASCTPPAWTRSGCRRGSGPSSR